VALELWRSLRRWALARSHVEGVQDGARTVKQVSASPWVMRVLLTLLSGAAPCESARPRAAWCKIVCCKVNYGAADLCSVRSKEQGR